MPFKSKVDRKEEILVGCQKYVMYAACTLLFKFCARDRSPPPQKKKISALVAGEQVFICACFILTTPNCKWILSVGVGGGGGRGTLFTGE